MVEILLLKTASFVCGGLDNVLVAVKYADQFNYVL